MSTFSVNRIFSALVASLPKFGGLRLRVISLLIMALLPAFVIMIITASESRRKAIDDIQANALKLTELVAVNQQQLIDESRDILITLAQVPAVQNQDRPACLFFLSNVLMQNPLYANFGASDSSGNIFCMTLPQRIPVNISDEEYFQNAMETLDFAISEYQISTINSQAIITLAYPVKNTLGQPQGIVFANLDLRWLGQFTSAATLPEGSILRVIDHNGIALASYPNGEIEIGKAMPESAIVQIVRDEKVGLVQSSDANGISRLFAFTPLRAGSDSDIYMIISIPTEAAFDESNRNLQRNLIALAVGAVAALITAWVGTQFFFLRQVNALVSVAQQLSSGDLTTRTDWRGGEGELDQLARAFDEMAAALESREQEGLLAQNQIRRQTARAEALARIAGHLNAKLELDSVLQAICDETSLTLNVPATGVVIYNSSTEELFRIGGPGLPATNQPFKRPQTSSWIEEVGVKQDASVLLVDLQGVFHVLPEAYTTINARYLICANLIDDGSLIGRLEIFFPENMLIDDDELTLLQGIAGQAALAITNARLYTALRIEEKARADLLHQIISVQEDERMRISRELHDETSQSLTALLVGLDTIRIASQSDVERIDKHICDLKTITQDMLANIHRLIADLRPSLLDDLGLVAAIEWYGEQRLKPAGLDFYLEDSISNGRLHRSVETTLFRITQEGLTNILRHSNASKVTVRLIQDHGLIVLEISDNGKGFDVQRLATFDKVGNGMGLLGIKERAEILGGSLSVSSAIGQGTTMRVHLPVKHDQEIDLNDPHFIS
ncbi:MAG: histidine kinase [Anaerolineaceae bacterium]|nr:histidine kinase [Anaerolineaceae bacterium]